MSYYDMIPDQLMVVPISGTRGGAALRSKVNLIETKCGYCGETFTRHTGHVTYTRTRKNKQMFFCSWKCLCDWDRENPARKKGGSTKTLEERIEFRMRRMVADRLVLDSEAAASMSAEEIRKIKNRMAWDAKQIRELGEELALENLGGV